MKDMAEDMEGTAAVMEDTMTMDMEEDMEGIIEDLDGVVLGNLKSWNKTNVTTKHATLNTDLFYNNKKRPSSIWKANNFEFNLRYQMIAVNFASSCFAYHLVETNGKFPCNLEIHYPDFFSTVSTITSIIYTA